MEYQVSGMFQVVEATGVRPYNIDGKSGVSQKVSLRADGISDREVRCVTSVDFSSFLGKTVEVYFTVEKGATLRVVGMK